jgi:hypothetical protein
MAQRGGGSPVGAPGAAPPQGAAPKGAPGPAGAGMMKPEVPKGSNEGAKADVMVATKVLMKAASTFGPMTPEGKAVLKAIMLLQKEFGQDDSATQAKMPAEIAQLLGALGGPGQAPQGVPPPQPGQPPQPIQ